ncbi:MAG: hypothetical protein MH252_22260 [Thermosynechococcaceae cyanobacterium MS004]|nr:hypothetical protein [Thermosynechococcaceae cyanobacterium MS004]
MEFLYYLGNASLALRVLKYLKNPSTEPIEFVTVVHQLDGWVLRVRCTRAWTAHRLEDFRAFLNELGVAHCPNPRLHHVLMDLEEGYSPIEVMQQYQVAVIEHGQPNLSEIEAFRQQFIQGLGYCPETLG